MASQCRCASFNPLRTWPGQKGELLFAWAETSIFFCPGTLGFSAPGFLLGIFFPKLLDLGYVLHSWLPSFSGLQTLTELLLGCPGSTAHTWQTVRLLGLHNHVNQLLYKSPLIFTCCCSCCCCCSVAQSCPTLCDPMDCRMPGFSVLHHFPELAQTHVRQVSDAIQPTHPPLSPSPPAFNLFQH